jgi:MFS transporter, PPP family, 3-phenylpropionic acid transporter
VPSLILYFLLNAGWTTATILLCGAGYSIASLANVLRLPDPRLNAPAKAATTTKRLPTAMAARLLWRPNMRIFCAGMFLLYLGLFGFSSFYPLYLVDIVGVAEKWAGLIFSVGVAIEIGFLLSLGWLQTRFGLRRIMILGAGCFILQSLALGLFPTVWVAVLVQSVHGMIVLAVFISPVMYLNQQAGDRFRNSIQGLFAMAILGVSRTVAIVAAGQIAQVNLRLIPFIATALGLLALILFAFNFKDTRTEEQSPGP